MNTKAIIYTSYHYNNTVNLVKNAVNELDYDWYNLLKDKDIEIPLSKYDTIIFASGIYYLKMHKVMINFLLKNQDELRGKKIIAVITAGQTPKSYARRVNRHFKNLKIENVPIFSCLGFDTYGPLKLIGGVNKGKPSAKDVSDLKEFLSKNNL